MTTTRTETRTPTLVVSAPDSWLEYRHLADAAADAASTPEESYEAYRAVMAQYEAGQRAMHPLRTALEWIAYGGPEHWRVHLGASYQHHSERNLLLYLASEASSDPLASYTEEHAEERWRFLRRVRREGMTVDRARKLARQLVERS